MCRLSSTTLMNSWNLLDEAWLEVSSPHGAWRNASPLESLRSAGEIRCIGSSSPLDEYAAIRFLTTLLYWKADAAGGVVALRESLIAGKMPTKLVDAIAFERARFDLFDPKIPFLQDPSIGPKMEKPVGSLFAEISTGTNIAHFNHSRDGSSPLCVACVARGMLRLVPWTQSGGAGLMPSIHGAPPVALLAVGASLAETLGISLVPLTVPIGAPTWTGTFCPTQPTKQIPFLEALTWNPRRVLLPKPRAIGRCALCASDGPVIHEIAFKKSESVGKPVISGDKSKSFDWRDPAFCYPKPAPDMNPFRSGDEQRSAMSTDLGRYARGNPEANSAIAAQSAAARWTIVVPSTNPTNNKTFDHRRIAAQSLANLPALQLRTDGADCAELGSGQLQISVPRAPHSTVVVTLESFVKTAVAALSETEWLVLQSAIRKPMHAAPAAFAIFSAIYWRTRTGNRHRLSRSSAWMLIKLMSIAPATARASNNRDAASLETILDSLPLTQGVRARSERPAKPNHYPLSLPTGHQLEDALLGAIEATLARGHTIPWIPLGCFIQLTTR